MNSDILLISLNLIPALICDYFVILGGMGVKNDSRTIYVSPFQKIYEDSICLHQPYRKEVPNENQSSNEEIRRSIADEIRYSKLLTDVGLNNIHIHISELESSCISAERVDLSKIENKERRERLRKSLRNSPYHFIEVLGVFVVDKGVKIGKK